MSETIRVTITLISSISFCLRMVGLSEESKIKQKFFALTDEEKEAGKEYELNVQTIAELCTELPTGMYPDGATPKTPVPLAVKDYFKDKTVAKERIAEYVVRAYLAKLMPEISFQ